MTYPKGDPRSPKNPTSPIRSPNKPKRHLKKFAVASLILTLLFSYAISEIFVKDKNSKINLVAPTVTKSVRQAEGPYTIIYKTTGPIFSSFHMACTPTGTPDLGPYYNCIKLNYDGKPGIVELKIPAELLKELPWINRANIFPFIDTSFQLLSQNDFYRVFRIDLPPGYDSVSLVGGTKMDFPYSFLFSFLVFGVVFFILLWIGIIVFYERSNILMDRIKSIMK